MDKMKKIEKTKKQNGKNNVPSLLGIEPWIFEHVPVQNLNFEAD